MARSRLPFLFLLTSILHIYLPSPIAANEASQSPTLAEHAVLAQQAGPPLATPLGGHRLCLLWSQGTSYVCATADPAEPACSSAGDRITITGTTFSTAESNEMIQVTLSPAVEVSERDALIEHNLEDVPINP